MGKAISAALLVGGLLFLFFGYQETQSLASEVDELITGTPTQDAIWMIILGAVLSVFGIIGLTRR